MKRMRHQSIVVILASALMLPLAGISQEKGTADSAAAAEPGEIKDIRALVKTTRGEIKLVLFAKKAPMTAANFLNLAKRGYYEGIVFHRVVPGFVIQVGDPLTLDPAREAEWGRGGPGYTIDLEVIPDLLHHSAGVLSMARKPQPNTAGSQFFITLDATPHLDNQYAVFGEVTEGLDVVKSIVKGDKIEKIEVLDSTDALFSKMERKVAEWNKILDARAKAEQ